MQAYPDDWNITLYRLFGDRLIKSSNLGEIPKEEIELTARINFKFNIERYIDFKKSCITENHIIIRTGIEHYKLMRGSVIPSRFWNNAKNFCQNGIGFSLFYQGKLASTAFSAFIFNKKLEIGIETFSEFRGKGLAQYACSALIEYCLKNDYEPIWACSIRNINSYKLARKLGFFPELTLPYYRLAL